ncbi:hypothetical protein BK673_22375 [Pseudomonas fluorescens]|uniref:Uncharacterized protein n=1 Tax=Pseudomonas fluorescens TaxID=294 RepID=A0A423P1X7_PSEFL|nr:hypothetical protein BOW65_05015 [Pseudomonas koreensis]ROO05001.1 hypothetical protein BK673_22375 [Pseudomonas fluorescens]TKJ85334.1 hypothetical protein PkoCFBP13504_09025 [Pseudomonas koreensis]
MRSTVIRALKITHATLPEGLINNAIEAVPKTERGRVIVLPDFLEVFDRSFHIIIRRHHERLIGLGIHNIIAKPVTQPFRRNECSIFGLYSKTVLAKLPLHQRQFSHLLPLL